MAKPFAARALDPVDLPAARALADELGASGVYVSNFLSRGTAAGDDGELLGLYGAEALAGLAFFGARGNLILLEAEPVDAAAVARSVQESANVWRIALGPHASVAALAAGLAQAPLVHRRQEYFGMAPSEAARAAVDASVRLAERHDLAMLSAAAVELNRVDLHVDPSEVHRGWLKETLRRRIRAAQTWVLGPRGAPECKLDVGSSGPAGVMLEGVYTVPAARGRGLATRLVASVAAALDAPLVALHVAAGNAAARKAYARAGMRPMGECSLLLRR